MAKIKICALGGLNEKGKNMYVVEVDNDIFVFEAGLKYASDDLLGIDYIIPDFSYLVENKDRIVGLFITHGHDDQIGAIADLLNYIPDIKIYGGKFTLEIIKQDLEEEKIKANLIEINAHKQINFGKNSIFPIQVSHALPDSFLYVLNTVDGAIVFTGNYVFDPTMTGPYKTDIGKLAYIGKQGVLCLMSECLYSNKLGFTSPNHLAYELFTETLLKTPGRVLINIFGSQIYRIQELLNAVTNSERNIVIMGKNLESIIIKSINMGLIKFDKNRIKNIHHVNDEGIVVIISNEKERPYSSLKRILRKSDKFITLKEEDTVVIASPIYEGIELTSTKIFDDIAKVGSKLIILSKKFLSPHASREDILMMINLMQPKYFMPVNGEYRCQVEAVNAAKVIGYDDTNTLLRLNGQATTFINGKLVDNGETIKVDDVFIDGKDTSDIGDMVLKDRELLADNGIVIVTATIDKATKKILAKPIIMTKGFVFVKDNIDLIKEAEKISLEILESNIKGYYVDYSKVKYGIRDKLGKYFYNETECKPMIIVVMQEI